MSFARFSETSDVYIFSHYLGYIECCGCALVGTFEADSLEEILDHISEHRIAGHKIPEGLEDFMKANVSEDDFAVAKNEEKPKTPVDGIKPEWRELMEEFGSDSKLIKANYINETVLEQQIRLARENMKDVIAARIESKHSRHCFDGLTRRCSHYEDAQEARETE